jgi:hypothetical protein
MKKFVAILLSALFLTTIVYTSASAIGSFGYAMEVLSENVTLIKTGLFGKKITFSDSDFKSALCLSDFESITVTQIPPSTEGTLYASGRRVKVGRVISRRHLSTLTFVPATDEVAESRFLFSVDGYAGGEEIECVMKFIDRVNYAPKIDSAVSAASVKTQEGISVYGRLDGEDPEGDGLEFIIVTYPKRGTIDIVDTSSGRYYYTPEDGYTGSDRFTYVVRDEYGNYSEPTSVNLRVSARMCEVDYYDMEGREEYNAAIAMTAMGIMDGRVLGDGNYFEPDKALSRAEFLSVAMKASGIKADSTLSSSFFDDDGEIPPALRGYVATAQRLGVVVGDFKDGQLLFSPNEEITKYEAAKIMCALLGADGEGEESVFAEESVPVWARSAVGAMRSLGIFETDSQGNLSDSVTRADAAMYLYKLSEIK